MAKDLKVGDVALWNFGYTSKVAEIVKETEKTIIFKFESAENGKLYTRRLSKNRIVGILK